MRVLIFISALFPLVACSQSSYDRAQDTKINKAISDITTIKATLTKLVADTLAKGKRILSLEKRAKTLEDSVNKYKSWLSPDFRVDNNKVITIPKLPLIEARVTKLEAKR